MARTLPGDLAGSKKFGRKAYTYTFTYAGTAYTRTMMMPCTHGVALWLDRVWKGKLNPDRTPKAERCEPYLWRICLVDHLTAAQWLSRGGYAKVEIFELPKETR